MDDFTWRWHWVFVNCESILECQQVYFIFIHLIWLFQKAALLWNTCSSVQPGREGFGAVCPWGCVAKPGGAGGMSSSEEHPQHLGAGMEAASQTGAAPSAAAGCWIKEQKLDRAVTWFFFDFSVAAKSYISPWTMSELEGEQRCPEFAFPSCPAASSALRSFVSLRACGSLQGCVVT